jgi:NADPH-dependent 2,4-dienoyl-CoA reductase/sulfur reductase-like enzyme
VFVLHLGYFLASIIYLLPPSGVVSSCVVPPERASQLLKPLVADCFTSIISIISFLYFCEIWIAYLYIKDVLNLGKEGRNRKRSKMNVSIIGAGDAGAIAALQIRRLDKEAHIDIFSKRAELGCPPCEMPLVLDGAVSSWEELFRGLRTKSFYEKRSMNLHLDTEVTDILRDEKCIIADGEKYIYDKVLLALGATPIIPYILGLDGRNEFTLSTDIADGRALEDIIPKYNSVAIVGGGFIALEVSAALKSRGYDMVYLLVRQDIMRSYLDSDMAEKLKDIIRENGVELVLPAKINSITSDGRKKRVTLADREIEVDFMFFAAGAKPNVKLARKAGLKIGETGAISVNQYLQTSDPNIYAAGDCMENRDIITGSNRRHLSATNAVRTGYIAGRNVGLGNSFVYEGTVMPFVTKIFGHQVGAVGLTDNFCKEHEIEAASVSVNTPWLRKRFGGKPAFYKLVADRNTGALIGGQVISEEIVSGTIDKLAVAIANKMPLTKLVQIDSCYSPYVQEDQIAGPIQRLIDVIG